MGGPGLSPDAGLSVGPGVGLLDGLVAGRAEDEGSGFFGTRLDKYKDWVLDGGFRATSPDR